MFETLIENAQVPSAPALQVGSARSYSYANMAADIRRCAAWLGKAKLGSPKRAVLHGLDPYMQWVLFYALEARGIVSIAMMGHSRLDGPTLGVLEAGLVFSGQPGSDLPGVKWVFVDKAFDTALRTFRPLPLPPRKRNGSDPICIILSTGTTGTPKKVLITRDLLDTRTRHTQEAGFVRAGARLACMLPMESTGGLLASMQAWLIGGTLVNPRDGLVDLVNGRINSLAAAPGHLERILKVLPDDMPYPKDLAILCGGGTLSHSLRQRLRERLSEDITVGYGATETGLVTRGDPEIAAAATAEVAGPVLPWMRVEIIGEDGTVLPAGETGEVRVTGEDCVDGYLESPEETARYFRDGWFHPGDVGHIDASGNLVVTGRIDDLMNFSGFKILPSQIEAAVLALPGVEDAVAFALADEQGAPVLWIAYCADSPVPVELFEEPLRRFPRLQVVRVADIPRNAMGKIERAAMRGQASEGLLATLS